MGIKVTFLGQKKISDLSKNFWRACAGRALIHWVGGGLRPVIWLIGAGSCASVDEERGFMPLAAFT